MELKTLYGGSVDIRTHQPAGEVGVVKGVAKDGAPKIRQYPYWVSDGGTAGLTPSPPRPERSSSRPRAARHTTLPSTWCSTRSQMTGKFVPRPKTLGGYWGNKTLQGGNNIAHCKIPGAEYRPVP